ncbi:DJ-1/PfpI family protein [Haladaptatus sp. CMAA 1911]|uniref:DJ-1/PfpI family protein n=1 Tax=unclassified Haladaptatus TaxID=2622732 RepID=UPI003754E27B
MEIAIVLFEGFDELDAIGPYEVFENAGDAGADLAVSLCTLAETERITASHGLRVEPDATLDECSPDIVVVPGGGWNDRSEAGARAEAERGDIPDALAALYDRGTTVAAVCTGGMLLSHAGLLDGRPAVTHAGALPDLRDSAARVVDARVVDDGDILTAGGVTSGIDLAFHVVEHEFGAEIARTVAEEMEYDPSDDVYADDGT